jgi:serine/threonine protein kinase
MYLHDRQERMEKLEIKIDKMEQNEAENLLIAHFQKETNFLRQKRRKMRMGEFELLALIGKGSFGCVYLSRKFDTGEILALKKMEKSNFDNKNKVK